MTSGRFQQRVLAKVLAYELLYQARVRRFDAELDGLLREALVHNWPDVEALAWYAMSAQQNGGPTDAGHLIDSMLKAADRAQDAALYAAGLAARACLPEDSVVRASFSADRDIARAVALLDEVGGDQVNAPTAYIACGIAYQQRSLWELALDMYDKAEQLLEQTFLPPFDRVSALTSRALLLHRMDGRVPLACHLMELDARGAAAGVAQRRPRMTEDIRTALPPQLRDEIGAVDSLLAAIAKEREPQPPFQLLDSLHPTERATFRSYVMLGQAIRAVDADDPARAAARAEIALLHLRDAPDSDITTLVMKLAALADRPSPGWQRYAEESRRRRDDARLVVLDAARAQLDAERVKLENERLSHRVYVDELTGLANRHAYSRQMARLRQASADEIVGVLMVDVDHFKAVNDTFGHQAGDSVLRTIGTLILKATRANDTAVRMGGDEFLVLLMPRSDVDVAHRGTQLVEAVADYPWEEIANGLKVGVSVGTASGPARDVDRLIADADRSLYQRKSVGRRPAPRAVAG